MIKISTYAFIAASRLPEKIKFTIDRQLVEWIKPNTILMKWLTRLVMMRIVKVRISINSQGS